uniref:Aldoketomutase n=1 Tax=Graphocephala atropunctata TaxID=36148 RepID=A0A1B6LPV1_9HEMI
MSKTSGLSDAEIQELCHEPDADTKEFILQQFMYNIKDPRQSLPFYTEVLGMRLFQKYEIPSRQRTAYFLGYGNASEIPSNDKDRTEWMLSCKVTIELTHKWGSENNNDVNDNNHEKGGFGHIGLMVPDVAAACARFDKLCVPYEKLPRDGRTKGVVYIKDPDGYCIEIFNAKDAAELTEESNKSVIKLKDDA